MSTELHTRQAATYTGPSSREATLAEALGCIIHGLPLPEGLRPPSFATARPASAEAWIGRTLSEPRAT
jgi:hypothetical protein